MGTLADFMKPLTGKNVVAVHAHPDDEALWTGGFLAKLAMDGATVTVVTCTLGEQGEVIGDRFAHLIADEADQLGGFRIGELQQSLKYLGCAGLPLGYAGKYRDSGMKGDPANNHPRAFMNAGDEAVHDLVTILLELKPDLIVTYGPDGGYGHPDHIHAHEITHQAVHWIKTHRAHEATVRRILWAVQTTEHMNEGLTAITAVPAGWRHAQQGELATTPNADITVDLEGPSKSAWTKKMEAMKAHATQIWVADGTVNDTIGKAAYAQVSDAKKVPAVFALSNLIAQPLLATEDYQIGWTDDSAGECSL